MKFTIKSAALMLAMSLSASAVTVFMDEGTIRGHKVVDTSGARLAEGSLIRYGTMSGAVVSSTNFVEFASRAIAPLSTVTGVNSVIFGYITADINVATTLPIGNKQIYMWIYNAATANAATQQGLFTSVGWVPPTDFNTNTASEFTMILGQSAAQATAGTFAPAITAVPVEGFNTGTRTLGVVASGSGTANSNGNIFTLGTAIPETSTTLLGALGALALLRRRRN